MNKKEFFFRNIFVNMMLCFVVISIMAFTLSNNIVSISVINNKVIYKGESTTKVALMINVYGGTEYISQMLDTLDANNVKATFFVGGCWADDNDQVLQQIHNRGEEIGNHGFFHKDQAKLNESSNREEIVMCHKLVESIIGYNMTLFAPPSGSFSNTTVNVAENLGYKTIMWTRDTIDWRDQDVNLIFNRATSKTVAGDFILMHPTKATVEALDRIIKAIKAKNLMPSTVSETLLQSE